jgi:hypothetical protein
MTVAWLTGLPLTSKLLRSQVSLAGALRRQLHTSLSTCVAYGQGRAQAVLVDGKMEQSTFWAVTFRRYCSVCAVSHDCTAAASTSCFAPADDVTGSTWAARYFKLDF